MFPGFKYYFYPFLQILCEENKVFQLSELGDKIAIALNLSESQKSELTKGGKLTKHLSRVNYCASYLRQMKLVKTVVAGKYQITQRGRDILEEYGESLTLAELRNLPEFKTTQISSSNTDIVYVKPHKRGNKMIAGYFCNRNYLKPNNPNIVNIVKAKKTKRQ